MSFAHAMTSLGGILFAILNFIFPFWIFYILRGDNNDSIKVRRYRALTEDYDINDRFRKSFLGFIMLKRLL